VNSGSTTTSEFGKPYNLMFSAASKIPGICSTRTNDKRPETNPLESANYKDKEKNPFVTGDLVYVRDATGKCDKEWSGPHRVSKIVSRVSFEINNDGIARHINHGRIVPKTRKHIESDSDEFDIEVPKSRSRYPQRSRRPPDRYGNYINY